MFLPTPPGGAAWVATSSHDGSVKIWDQHTAGNTHLYTERQIPTHTWAHIQTLFGCFNLFTLTLLQPSLRHPLFSLFRDVVSGRRWSTGFSGSQWLQQSAVCQLQLRPPPYPGGPGIKPGSGFWGRFRWSWWPGHKSCGTLLMAQRSLVWLWPVNSQWLSEQYHWIWTSYHFFFCFCFFTILHISIDIFALLDCHTVKNYRRDQWENKWTIMTCMEVAPFVQQRHLDAHHSCSPGRLLCKSHYH